MYHCDRARCMYLVELYKFYLYAWGHTAANVIMMNTMGDEPLKWMWMQLKIGLPFFLREILFFHLSFSPLLFKRDFFCLGLRMSPFFSFLLLSKSQSEFHCFFSSLNLTMFISVYQARIFYPVRFVPFIRHHHSYNWFIYLWKWSSMKRERVYNFYRFIPTQQNKLLLLL